MRGVAATCFFDDFRSPPSLRRTPHPMFLLQRTFDHERRRQIRTPLGGVFVRIFLCWLQQVRLRGFVPGPLLSQFVGIHPGCGGWLPGALLQGARFLVWAVYPAGLGIPEVIVIKCIFRCQNRLVGLRDILDKEKHTKDSRSLWANPSSS